MKAGNAAAGAETAAQAQKNRVGSSLPNELKTANTRHATKSIGER